MLQGLHHIIKKSGIQMPPESYIHMVITLTAAVTISSAIAAAVLFIFLKTIVMPIIVLSIPTLIFSSLMLYPYSLKVHRSSKFKPHILEMFSLINALSRSTNDIDYIMGVIAESLDKELGEPFRIYLYNRTVLGMDTVDAIRRAAERCPSDELTSAFISIADAVESTGDPSNIMRHIFEGSIVRRRGELEKKVRNSMIIGEFYISLVILLPTVLMVTLVIFSMVGGSVFGLDPALLMTLVTYLTIPFSMMLYLMVGD